MREAIDSTAAADIQTSEMEGRDRTTYFWRALEQLRKERDLPKAAIARMAEVAANTVQGWKNGSSPDFVAVEKLALGLGVSLDRFSERVPTGAGKAAIRRAASPVWDGVKRYVATARGSDTPPEVVLGLLEQDFASLKHDPSCDDDVHEVRGLLQKKSAPATSSVLHPLWTAALERNFQARGFPAPAIVTALYRVRLDEPEEALGDIDARVRVARDQMEKLEKRHGPRPAKSKRR